MKLTSDLQPQSLYPNLKTNPVPLRKLTAISWFSFWSLNQIKENGCQCRQMDAVVMEHVLSVHALKSALAELSIHVMNTWCSLSEMMQLLRAQKGKYLKGSTTGMEHLHKHKCCNRYMTSQKQLWWLCSRDVPFQSLWPQIWGQSSASLGLIGQVAVEKTEVKS